MRGLPVAVPREVGRESRFVLGILAVNESMMA